MVELQHFDYVEVPDTCTVRLAPTTDPVAMDFIRGKFGERSKESSGMYCVECGESNSETSQRCNWCDTSLWVGSPLERDYFFAMDGGVRVGPCDSPLADRLCWLRPQYEWTPYRLDFATTALWLAIEVDGHEYHKSKEQRVRDYRRERTLMLFGWTVVRFTGSDIHRDVAQCCWETDKIATVVASRRGVSGLRK